MFSPPKEKVAVKLSADEVKFVRSLVIYEDPDILALIRPVQQVGRLQKQLVGNYQRRKNGRGEIQKAFRPIRRVKRIAPSPCVERPNRSGHAARLT